MNKHIVRLLLLFGLSEYMEAAISIASTLFLLSHGFGAPEIFLVIGIFHLTKFAFRVSAATMVDNWGWEFSLSMALIAIVIGAYIDFTIRSLWMVVLAEAVTGAGLALLESALEVWFKNED